MIPGHGGVMDRMDCQFITALFTTVYYNTFIRYIAPFISLLIRAESISVKISRTVNCFDPEYDIKATTRKTADRTTEIAGNVLKPRNYIRKGAKDRMLRIATSTCVGKGALRCERFRAVRLSRANIRDCFKGSVFDRPRSM